MSRIDNPKLTPEQAADLTGAGKRPVVDQLTRADLVGMSAEQVVEAKAAGQLDDLLSGKTGGAA